MKIKLEQNANGEWHWFSGSPTYGHGGNGIQWRRGSNQPLVSREAAITEAKVYVDYINKLQAANKIVTTEELEL